jgi:hypothetical protein
VLLLLVVVGGVVLLFVVVPVLAPLALLAAVPWLRLTMMLAAVVLSQLAQVARDCKQRRTSHRKGMTPGGRKR